MFRSLICETQYRFDGNDLLVGPQFYSLPIDQKKDMLYVAWAWYVQEHAAQGAFLHVKDSRTGKRLGSVSRDTGVSLDLK